MRKTRSSSSEASRSGREEVRGPIFIVGCQRSGTSMLTRMLSKHSQVKIIVGESGFYRVMYGNRLASLAGNIDSRRNRERLRAYLKNRKEAKREWSAVQFDDWMATYEELGVHSYMGLYHALMLTFAQASYPPGDACFYIGTKEPGDLQYVGRLLSHFPDAKIINMVRDGRAVVASMLNGPVGPSEIARALVAWKYAMRLTRQCETRISRANYLRVSYEQLLGEPDKVLGSITDYLGIAYEPAMLESDLSGLSSFAAKNRDPGVDPSRSESFRDELSGEDLRLLEFALERELRAYGYLNQGQTVVPVRLPASLWARIWLEYARVIAGRSLRRGGTYIGVGNAH